MHGAFGALSSHAPKVPPLTSMELHAFCTRSSQLLRDPVHSLDRWAVPSCLPEQFTASTGSWSMRECRFVAIYVSEANADASPSAHSTF
eukprot:6158443-Pleurochrysis_carterae.AAC.1